MGTMSLFGSLAQVQLELASANLDELPNEAELLQAVRDKVGRHADRERLIWHLRASRGKVTWAVNSYLRAVLALPLWPLGEDFDPPLAPAPWVAPAAAAPADGEQQREGAPSSSSSSNDSPLGAAPAVQLDGLPAHVLERLLARLDLSSLLAAACTCQALHRAAQADSLWAQLFQQRWGDVVFPTCSSREHHTSSGGRLPVPAGSSGGAREAAAATGSSPARQPVPAFAASASAQPASSKQQHAGCARGQHRQPPASWQAQFKRQHAYQSERRCVKCGAAEAIVPIVYGFPSIDLLAGMEAHPQRLVLGGDHLIDSCHVWACSSCRCAFRFWPYDRVQLWLADDEAQQRRNATQAAAGRSRAAGAAAAAAAGGGGPDDAPGAGGGNQPQQPEQQGGSEHDDDDGHLPAGMQRYTYEL